MCVLFFVFQKRKPSRFTQYAQEVLGTNASHLLARLAEQGSHVLAASLRASVRSQLLLRKLERALVASNLEKLLDALLVRCQSHHLLHELAHELFVYECGWCCFC